jgi:hypothetical protein
MGFAKPVFEPCGIPLIEGNMPDDFRNIPLNEHRRMPQRLRSLVTRQTQLNNYDAQIRDRDARPVPSLPRVAWLERPELPDDL